MPVETSFAWRIAKRGLDRGQSDFFPVFGKDAISNLSAHRKGVGVLFFS